MAVRSEQRERALEAVRQYLPPQDSSGFNIITGECLGQGAPLSSRGGRFDHASAASVGTFHRQRYRQKETLAAKLTAKSRRQASRSPPTLSVYVSLSRSCVRSKEDWVSDLAAAAAGSQRHGRRSPLRQRPASADAAVGTT